MTGLWSHVREEYGCWVWTGSVSNRGYGQVGINGRVQSAHRAAWRDLRGDIPAGLQIDHLCANKPCVNPWHMELVDARTNMRRRQHADRFCVLPPATAPWNRGETAVERRMREEREARCAEIDRRMAALDKSDPDYMRKSFEALFGGPFRLFGQRVAS